MYMRPAVLQQLPSRVRRKVTQLSIASLFISLVFISGGTNYATAASAKPGLTSSCVNIRTGLVHTLTHVGCNSKTEKAVYLTEPAMITVYFAGGATVPTNVKSFSPKYWNGLLCSPSLYKFSYTANLGGVIPSPIGKFVTKKNMAGTAKQIGFASSYNGPSIFINDNCRDDMIFYACRPAGGSDSDGGYLNHCAPAVRQTSVKSLGFAFSLTSGPDPNGPLTNAGAVIIFYCGNRDKLVAPPAAPLISCVRPL
jgi:hypothetical protein